ncbi:hypothetical protein LPJ61_005452 [Coemansia biformis]|uniref:Phosphatidic acid phosphatase type 2/haloperoxidase domain-containing protein n=1 Tax=Coemansia biformis TaxID=1286918 RepID=A0A9W7Y9V7_9FUNG|nr:hypothetical protein LPJ61_005452 [Coemansia biformis]
MGLLGRSLSTGRDGQPRTRRSRLILSYLPDYAVLVVMAALWGLISLIHPFHREFSLTDKTIQYPNKPDSVPFYAAVVLAFVLPLVVIVLWTGLLRRSFHDMNVGILGLCMALVLNMMVTNTVKNLAGRLRPDFIDRCNLDLSQVSEPTIGLLTSAVCRQADESFLLDGMRSFPSGHSSFSFAGLGYITLWLCGHMNIVDCRGRTYKSFVALAPLLGALLISVSRTKDYRHHWQDVLAGALLGVAMAWFAYLQYYPSPLSADVDTSQPFPPRIPDEPDQQSFVLKSFRHTAGAGATPGAASMPAAGVHGQAGGGAESAYSQQFSSPQVALSIPEQPHVMQSRESLVR